VLHDLAKQEGQIILAHHGRRRQGGRRDGCR
jgi:hypothetical protein